MSSDITLDTNSEAGNESLLNRNTPADETSESNIHAEESSQTMNENDCSFQSEDHEELVAELDPRDVDESSEVERKMTSWESFTAILKGLVEELVELGAQPELRKVSFQLWASYLKHENVAFISNTEPKLPTLPVRFKNSDAKALYDVEQLKTFIIEDSMNQYASRISKGEESNLRNLKVKVPSLPRKSQPKIKQSYTIGRYLDDSESKRNVKILMKESAFKRIAEPAKEVMRQMKKHGENIPSNLPAYANRHHDRHIKSNAAVTVNTLLAILKLALYLLEDEIQLTDLLRWACEGRFSLYRVKKFLPKHAPIRETDVTPGTRKNFFKFELLRICEMLELNDVPSPDLFILIERYCDELSLPREFTKFTEGLMNMFPPHMDFALYDYRVFPDYECRAMGFIIFALKLLFSLDDRTELMQSHFANTVNRRAKCSTESIPPLFSWSSWVKFVECRKAVLSQYDVSMSQLYEYDDARTDINVFLNYWSKNEPDTSNHVSLFEKFKEETINRLSRAAEDHITTDENKETKFLQFPPSLTPLKTYTQHLLAHHSTLLSDRCREILSNDISSCTIRYLVDHKWAINIGKNIGLEVESALDSAISEQVQFVETESNKSTPSNVTPAHIPTPVLMEDNTDDFDTKNTFRRLKKFQPKFSSFKSINANNDSIFKLHYPSAKYWFFHNIDRTTKNENFNKIATENFPDSFLWLLKECSRIIRCSLYDLFIELVIIERVYDDLFADSVMYPYEKLLIYSNEW